MLKPVFILWLSDRISDDEQKKYGDALGLKLGDEYHVLIISGVGYFKAEIIKP